MPDERQIAELVALAEGQAGHRIGQVEFGGERFWIKHFDAADRDVVKKLYRLVGILPLPVHLRPSPAVDARGAVERETRKSKLFADAGIAVPPIVHADHRMIVMRDAGKTAYAVLMALGLQNDTGGYKSLLCDCFRFLARIHEAGLCHGRPNMHDIFVADGRISIGDFEEEPEAVMPLEAAQARDAWLLTMSAVDLPGQSDTIVEAIKTYRSHAPRKCVLALDEMLRFWHPLLSATAWIRHIKEGGDLRRVIGADAALMQSTLQPMAPERR